MLIFIITTCKIWDNHGEISDYATGYFVTGFMGEKQQAKWIGRKEESENILKYVSSFEYNGEGSAYILATAYGMYEIYINGRRWLPILDKKRTHVGAFFMFMPALFLKIEVFFVPLLIP